MTQIKFDHQFIRCDNFKSKHTPIILNTIGGSRLNRLIKFSRYANISYDADDIPKIKPIVNELDQFNRMKTNCLVYDVIFENSHFNKLFIYQSINARGNGGFYGYVLYNEETGKQWHKYFIDKTEDELCRSIWTSLWLLTDQAQKIYGEYI